MASAIHSSAEPSPAALRRQQQQQQQQLLLRRILPAGPPSRAIADAALRPGGLRSRVLPKSTHVKGACDACRDRKIKVRNVFMSLLPLHYPRPGRFCDAGGGLLREECRTHPVLAGWGVIEGKGRRVKANGGERARRSVGGNGGSVDDKGGRMSFGEERERERERDRTLTPETISFSALALVRNAPPVRGRAACATMSRVPLRRGARPCNGS